MWEYLTYVIIPTSEVIQDIINYSTDYSLDDSLKSLDGLDTLLEYDHVTHGDPSCFDGYTKYTHSQILIELRNPANGWQE